MKVVLATGDVTGVKATGADGVNGADGEMVPAEAVPTGTSVLLKTGYGATGSALLSGTTGAITAVLRMAEEAVLRMTAGVDEFATATGNDDTTGVTIGGTGVEERATG